MTRATTAADAVKVMIERTWLEDDADHALIRAVLRRLTRRDMAVVVMDATFFLTSAVRGEYPGMGQRIHEPILVRWLSVLDKI